MLPHSADWSGDSRNPEDYLKSGARPEIEKMFARPEIQSFG